MIVNLHKSGNVILQQEKKLLAFNLSTGVRRMLLCLHEKAEVSGFKY